MNKAILLSTVAALALVGSAARAADLGAAPYVREAAVTVPAAYSWSRFYIGGNVGGSAQSGAASSAADPMALSKLVSLSVQPPSTDTIGKGILGGIQAGANYQAGIFVVGLEGDIDWSDISGSSAPSWSAALTVPGGVIGPFSVNSASSAKLDWLSTARVRAGIEVTPRFLVYGTGGVAFGDATMTNSTSIMGPVTLGGSPHCLALCGGDSVSSTKTGWAAGAGMEYAVTQHWSVKAEYLHADLGTLSASYVTTGLAGIPSTTIHNTAKIQEDIGRLGVNYRF